jgi:hypothetical protein
MRPQRREIAACVASKPILRDVTLCLAERKPFGVLAEGLLSDDGRLVWQKFEPLVRDFLAATLEAAEADAAVFARFALKSA